MAEGQAWRVEVGDCLDVLERLEADSVDAVVTDPPYGLEFMGAEWDRPWAVNAAVPVGFASEQALGIPSPRDGRNANCKRCGGRARGAKRCSCAEPDWDRPPVSDMQAFQAWCERWARAVYRVLRPGGHVLAFGGTRTYHRLGCALEDAGFEIRDRVLTLNGYEVGAELAWLYGSGWPKSRAIGKAIDKRAGAEREVVAERVYAEGAIKRTGPADFGRINDDAWEPEAGTREVTAPATPEAEQWEGWGTALKPAHEPIAVARKPFRLTVEEQVLATGTGALHIDACRIDTGGEVVTAGLSDPANRAGVVGNAWQAPSDAERNQAAQRASLERANALGRWPANVVLLHAAGCERVGTRRVATGVTVRRNLEPGVEQPHTVYSPKHAHPVPVDVTYGDGDGMETIEAWECVEGCPVAQLDALSGDAGAAAPVTGNEPSMRDGREAKNTYGDHRNVAGRPGVFYGDRGGASRFFYQGKASTAEREYGLGEIDEAAKGVWPLRPRSEGESEARDVRNSHPTVKPIDLMRWLVRLVTPPGGLVLDPFTGSGSTGCAAALEGVRFLGIEREEHFAEIARRRILAWSKFPPGTPVERVLAEAGARARAAAQHDEARRELATAGQLDLLGEPEEPAA